MKNRIKLFSIIGLSLVVTGFIVGSISVVLIKNNNNNNNTNSDYYYPVSTQLDYSERCPLDYFDIDLSILPVDDSKPYPYNNYEYRRRDIKSIVNNSEDLFDFVADCGIKQNTDFYNKLISYNNNFFNDKSLAVSAIFEEEKCSYAYRETGIIANVHSGVKLLSLSFEREINDSSEGILATIVELNKADAATINIGVEIHLFENN